MKRITINFTNIEKKRDCYFTCGFGDNPNSKNSKKTESCFNPMEYLIDGNPYCGIHAKIVLEMIGIDPSILSKM